MTEPSNSSPPLFTHPFSPQSGQIQWASNVELADRRVSVAGTDTFHDHVRRRRSKDRAIIENPLGITIPPSTLSQKNFIVIVLCNLASKFFKFLYPLTCSSAGKSPSYR